MLHLSCICLIFLHCVFWNVSSNTLPDACVHYLCIVHCALCIVHCAFRKRGVRCSTSAALLSSWGPGFSRAKWTDNLRIVHCAFRKRCVRCSTSAGLLSRWGPGFSTAKWTDNLRTGCMCALFVHCALCIVHYLCILHCIRKRGVQRSTSAACSPAGGFSTAKWTPT